MTVDVHTHAIPSALLERAAGAGGLFGVVREGDSLVHPEGFRAPVSADFHSAEAVCERMEASGVGHSVLSLSPTLFFYGLPATEAVPFAREANDALAALVAEQEALLALAHLPMQDPDEAVGELERAVGELGMRGAQIGTNVEQLPLDDPRFERLFAAAARLGVPLMLHPYFVGPKPRLEAWFLTNTIGNPLDTCIAAARLMHAGTLDRNPDLRLLLVHGGGFLPYQLGRLDRAYEVREEARTELAEKPGSLRKRFWFDSITHSPQALRFLADLVGPERVVIGSDLPYDMAEDDPVGRLRSAGLEESVAAASAAELLGLEDGA